jgi:ribosomal protein L30/L7E
MDLMIDRKEFDKALRQILQGRNAQGPDVVDFTASRESLTVVVTGRSVEVAIEAAEIGSVSVPIAVVEKLKKVGKTYESEQVRLRATEGRVRLEGMSITNEGIRMRKIARRVIDIPQDARQMDLLGLRHIFTAVEIKDSELSAKVLEAEKKMAKRLDSAAKDLEDYEISRDELRALAEGRIRDYIPILRKAVLSD